MRSTFPAILAVLSAACSHVQPESLAGVTVVPQPEPCFDTLATEGALVTITNSTKRKIAFSVSGKAGPPYTLHPWVFNVAPADSATHDPSNWYVTALEEYSPPEHELSLGSGDRTQFHAYTTMRPVPGYPGKVLLRVKDTNGNTHESGAVPVCPGA